MREHISIQISHTYVAMLVFQLLYEHANETNAYVPRICKNEAGEVSSWPRWVRLPRGDEAAWPHIRPISPSPHVHNLHTSHSLSTFHQHIIFATRKDSIYYSHYHRYQRYLFSSCSPHCLSLVPSFGRLRRTKSIHQIKSIKSIKSLTLIQPSRTRAFPGSFFTYLTAVGQPQIVAILPFRNLIRPSSLVNMIQ